MKSIKSFFYKLIVPNQSLEEIMKYRNEFSNEKIVENMETIFKLMIGLEIVEIVITILPSILPQIRMVSLGFVISNGLLLIPVLIYKGRKYEAKYQSLLFLELTIVINFIMLASWLNIVAINSYDFVHIYIVAIMFISLFIFIPIIPLTLIIISTLILNLISVINLSTDVNQMFHMIDNLIIFSGIAWYLGLKSNRKTIELWYNHKVQFDLNKKLSELNKRDPMTRFYNHESILFKMDQVVTNARDVQEKCSILMLDIDDFKLINDTFGHQVGDKVILEVAKAIHQSVRDTDFIGRYGGEEFLVIMPNTSLSDAYLVGNRICEAVSKLEFDKIKMSISGGLAEFAKDDSDQLLGVADARLYKAKLSGKNQIVCMD